MIDEKLPARYFAKRCDPTGTGLVTVVHCRRDSAEPLGLGIDETWEAVDELFAERVIEQARGAAFTSA